MAHFDVDEARRRIPVRPPREHITFTLEGERFTALLEPTFGDVLDLAYAPDIPENPTKDHGAVIALAVFIELMLPDEDRPRWRAALRRIPGSDAAAIVELGVWLTEQVTGNPTTPPVHSLRGRSSTGGRAKRTTAGRTRSK